MILSQFHGFWVEHYMGQCSLLDNRLFLLSCFREVLLVKRGCSLCVSYLLRNTSLFVFHWINNPEWAKHSPQWLHSHNENSSRALCSLPVGSDPALGCPFASPYLWNTLPSEAFLFNAKLCKYSVVYSSYTQG